MILLSTFDDDNALVAGIRAGAMAFVLKDVEIGPLLETIRRVAAGENCMSGIPAERLVAALSRGLDSSAGTRRAPDAARKAGYRAHVRGTQ